MSSKAQDGTDVAAVNIEDVAECSRCEKIEQLCVCDEITPVDNRVEVLILQHPQEQDKMLGTARLAARCLKRSAVRVGLSWASLSRALGRPVGDPSRWAVLYLGSAQPRDDESARVTAIDRQGAPLEGQGRILRDIEGIVVLDGTWSQAKALWWRNAWMLKCQRVILNPSEPSRYGRLRREPRREGLSTIESVGWLLGEIGKKPEIKDALDSAFQKLLERYRRVMTETPGLIPSPPSRERVHRRKRRR